MQCITGWRNRQWGEVAHTVAVLGLVILAMKGVRLESLEGWVACPPRWVRIGRERQRGRSVGGDVAWYAGWAWMRRSWIVALVRSETLLLLAIWTGREEWEWVCLLPWVSWLWRGIGVACPSWRRWVVYRGVDYLLEEASRVALFGLVVSWFLERQQSTGDEFSVSRAGLGSVVPSPQVKITEDEEGICHVRLPGGLELHIDGKVPFYKRTLIIFLRQLEAPGEETRGSRRTRDERTPVVRQQQLAQELGVPQPNVSRWMKYWQTQDWRRLHSRQTSEVLTLEVQQRIIDTWVQFPWWGAERLWEHLNAQGEEIPLSYVRQAAQESGWSVLRHSLRRVYAISEESFRPRDRWLVSQLLAQVQALVAQLEIVGGLTPEQRMTLADLQALSQEIGINSAPARAPLPWVLQLEHILFGHWEPIADDTVRCLYCGSTHVSRKSKKPRLKRYVDDQGKEQTVEVYRYYCHNPACKYKTFTNLPPNLVPYSKWTLNHHLAALHLYEWSHSVYRCTGQLLGISKMTTYRWVSGFGYQLLPVAALFGVVRSSGAIGVDEKYVLVPKNDKPEAKMKEWVYVYFAVDCYTYDLLHIEIYPYNTKQSAKAFLLALRAKGYHPRVVVTDLRVDYGPLIARVFPKAVHHECIFHALQDAHKHIKEVYGTEYATTHPQVETLRKEIDYIFDARTKRTAQRRYQKVLAQQETFVTQTPEAKAIFDFLEHHWPKLVNAIESRIIPTTNNATEEVIRIFTQHYKTFCGFESIESARLYLGVFEKVYRFTPFSDDAQKRIRGKCPLELAGYEVLKLPMTQLFRGLALQWPTLAFRELVPNV
jgi:transposase-like protein